MYMLLVIWYNECCMNWMVVWINDFMNGMYVHVWMNGCMDVHCVLSNLCVCTMYEWV